MASHKSLSWPWLSLLLLATVQASVNALVLKDWEGLKVQVPTACASAYATKLTHCDYYDFMDNDPCSDKCRVSVEAVQSKIQQSCKGVSSNPNTLLGRGQAGHLVDVLCRSKPASTSTPVASSTPVATPSTTFASVVATTSPSAPSETAGTTPQFEMANPIATQAAAADATATEEKDEKTTHKAEQQGGGSPFDGPSGSGSSKVDVAAYGSWVVAGIAGMLVLV